ncbi:hypothetical protein ACFL2A_00885 [Thermodesulfobacteriota bacterium]
MLRLITEKRGDLLTSSLLLLFFIVTALIGGCGHSASTKDKKSLIKRLKLYARAMSVNDFDAAYSFESDTIKDKVSYDDYIRKKQLSNAEIEVYKVSTIKYDKRRDEYLVKIKAVLVNLPNGMELSLADIRGETWKFENGDWYRKGPYKAAPEKSKNRE